MAKEESILQLYFIPLAGSHITAVKFLALGNPVYGPYVNIEDAREAMEKLSNGEARSYLLFEGAIINIPIPKSKAEVISFSHFKNEIFTSGRKPSGFKQ